MSHLFDPPALPSAPIRGLEARFPIRRIFCVGRNYEAHAKEMGVQVDREAPFYFTKSAFAYVPSGATVMSPSACLPLSSGAYRLSSLPDFRSNLRTADWPSSAG